MKVIISFVLIFITTILYAQECKENFKNYWTNLDTTNRKVYLIVEELPSILEDDNNLRLKFSKDIDFSKLKCCPMYVYFAFVIEKDGMITNILICPKLVNCENEVDINNDNQIVISQFTKIISEFKTTAGKVNKKPVAMSYISRIHYECMNSF